MKKVFTFMASCLMVLGASAQSYELRTLTFEDSDYVGDEANYLGHQTDFWSSLIDSPQYGGTLLYGDNHGDTDAPYTSTNYKWYDKDNTYLYSELPENFGVTMYWGGGHAISNYWNANIDEGDYTNQLSVWVPNSSGSGQGGHGHNGSNNFAVHFGYKDGSPYNGTQNLPFFSFGDDQARTIDHMYVNNTTYAVNCLTNGNGLTAELMSGDYMRIKAVGYNEYGDETNPVYFYLATDSGNIVTNWTKWGNLYQLGNVKKVEFNIEGTSDNGYGFSQPAYFAYDDVAVRFPVNGTTETAVAKAPLKDESTTKTMTVTSFYRIIDGVKTWWAELTGDVPEGATATFESDGISSNAVGSGKTTTITVSGMPQNAKITALEAYVCAQFIGGVGIVSAKIGETEFAKLQFHGGRITGEWAVGTLVLDSYETLPFEMYDGVSTLCTDDIVITASNPNTGVNLWNEAVYIDYYNISYVTDTTTGIDEFSTINTDNTYYTLQGMRVTTPVKGQVYVKNGHKVVF